MPEPSYVQLPTDGAGKKVSTFEITGFDASGNAITVELEGVVITDRYGDTLVVGGRGNGRLGVSASCLEEKLDNLTTGIAHLLLLIHQATRPKDHCLEQLRWAGDVIDTSRTQE